MNNSPFGPVPAVPEARSAQSTAMQASSHWLAQLEKLKATRADLQRRFEDVSAAGDDSDDAWQKLQGVDAEITRAQASFTAAARREQTSVDSGTRGARERAEREAKSAYKNAMEVALRFEQAKESAAELHGELIVAFERYQHLQAAVGGELQPGSTLGLPAIVARIEGRYRQIVARQQRRDASSKATEPTIDSLASFLGVKRAGGFLSRLGF